MKKVISIIMTLVMLLSITALSGCVNSSEKLNVDALKGNYDVPELKGTEINVYNWGEYISDGSEGSLDTNKEFEKYCREVLGKNVTVNYSLYSSNEDLYAKLSSGAVSYDVIVPSDYMIARLAAEGLLKEMNPKDKIKNYKYIDEKFKGLYYDPEEKWSVPYTYGTVGIIYNLSLIHI